MGDEAPPLRVREADGSPNVIPTYTMVFSGATLTRTGPTEVTVLMDSGAGGVGATRAINTTYPLAGGGDLSQDRTHTVDTAFLVNTGRTLTAGLGLTGGGNLSADRTFTVNTAVIVGTHRTLSTLYPLSGGNTLAGDLTFAADTAFLLNTGRTITSGLGLTGGGNLSTDLTLVVNTAVIVGTHRTLTTLYPVSGGANLSADRTFAVDTAFLVNTGRTLSSGLGLSGGGDLSADRTLSVNTAVIVGTHRTLTAGAGLSGGGDLSADRTFSLVTPVAVTSGGLGVGTLTAYGLLYGSGTVAVQALAAANSGQLVIGSSLTTRPHLLAAPDAGQYLIGSPGVVGAAAWITTAAAATVTIGNFLLRQGSALTNMNSTGYASILGLSAAFVSTRSAIFAFLSMDAYNTVGGGNNFFALRIDSAAEVGELQVTQPNGNQDAAVQTFFVWTNQTIGSHVVDARWRVDSNTVESRGTNRRLVVMEGDQG